MPTVAQIRNSIQEKIFDAYGKSVTLKTQGTPTYNTRGEILANDFSTSSITIVPYDVFVDQEDMQPFGDMGFGDMAAAVPYTVTVSVGDYITIDSQDWEVKETVEHPLPDNLVTIIRLTKVVS